MANFLKHPYFSPRGKYNYVFNLFDPKNPDADAETIEDVNTASPEALRRLNELKAKITPGELANLFAGKYGHKPYFMDQIFNEFKNHPHVNKDLTRRALELTHDGETHQGANSGYRFEILENLPSDEKIIHEAIDNPGNHGDKHLKGVDLQRVLASNPNLNKDHINKMIDKGFVFGSSISEHPALDDEMRRKMFLNKQYSGDYSDLLKPREDGSKPFTDEELYNHIQDNPEHYSLSSSKIHNVLNSMSPEARKESISKIIGLHGGKPYNSPEEGEELNSEQYDSEYGWDNWRHGKDHNRSLSHLVAQSPHLSDEHAEHIMRHGNLEDKWSLFHNTQINPKYADQMSSKWMNDDSGHGYDIDDFKQKIKDDNEFNYDDYHDEVREKVEEENPIDEWLADNVSEYDLMGVNRDDWIDEHLEGSYDWTHTPEKENEDDDEPEEVDYSGRYKEDHPEYRQRYSEAEEDYEKALKAAKENAEGEYYDQYRESNLDRMDEIAQEMYDEEMENAHENPKYLPSHLSAIEDIKRKAEERKRKKAFEAAELEEKKHSGKLNEYIPNRAKEHLYGPGQHHLEMAKEHADANKGSIDIGTLNKMYPSSKDKWKSVFGDKGKLSSEELQAKIDAHPKSKYNLSYKIWGGNSAQNINKRDQVVVRLDHSPESLAELQKDPELYDTFNKINEVSMKSGHPTNQNTIGWARVDFSDPKNPMIDEAQSDFGKEVRKYLEKEGGEAGAKKAEHLDKLMAMQKDWRETLLNAVKKISKDNGAEALFTHSPESKTAHTGAGNVHSVYKDSYSKVPRALGFKEVEMNEMPLSEDGAEVFRKGKSGVGVEDLIESHTQGALEHAIRAQAHAGFAKKAGDDAAFHKDISKKHVEKAKAHINKINTIEPLHWASKVKSVNDIPKLYFKDNGLEDGQESKDIISNITNEAKKAKSFPTLEYDKALTSQPNLTQGHKGHKLDLNPKIIKSEIEYAETLMKAEVGYKVAAANAIKKINDLKPLLDQLKTENPAIYQSITHLAGTLTKIFNGSHNKTLEEHGDEQEIKQHLKEGQPEQETKVSIPRHADQVTRPLPTYAAGTVRDYGPGNEKMKTSDGKWLSVAGGKAVDPITGQRSE